jgi:hypothetical protein
LNFPPQIKFSLLIGPLSVKNTLSNISVLYILSSSTSLQQVFVRSGILFSLLYIFLIFFQYFLIFILFFPDFLFIWGPKIDNKKENVVFSSGLYAYFLLNFNFFLIYIPPFPSEQTIFITFPSILFLGILLMSMYFFSFFSMVFSRILFFFLCDFFSFYSLKMTGGCEITCGFEGVFFLFKTKSYGILSCFLPLKC